MEGKTEVSFCEYWKKSSRFADTETQNSNQPRRFETVKGGLPVGDWKCNWNKQKKAWTCCAVS